MVTCGAKTVYCIFCPGGRTKALMTFSPVAIICWITLIDVIIVTDPFHVLSPPPRIIVFVIVIVFVFVIVLLQESGRVNPSPCIRAATKTLLWRLRRWNCPQKALLRLSHPDDLLRSYIFDTGIFSMPVAGIDNISKMASSSAQNAQRVTFQVGRGEAALTDSLKLLELQEVRSCAA